jgi:putative endonuclease
MAAQHHQQTRTMRQRLGDFGEQAAAAYLTRHGYTILARNWRCRAGEIDLIARQGAQLVFVEVRTRRSNQYGPAPAETITPAKQARLIALAYAYLETCATEEAGKEAGEETISWRIDVVAIELGRGGRIAHLEHIPNAIEQA